MNNHLRAASHQIIRIIAVLALLLIAASAPGPAALARRPAAQAPKTLIDADVASSTIWTLAKSPYLVIQPISVLAPATLTLEAGVEVRFLQDAGITIAGGMIARGSHAQPVSFVADAANIQWRGLSLSQPAANVTLQGVTIKNALNGLALNQAGGSPTTTARVEVLESLLDSNVVGVSATYGAAATPHLTLRNNLITNNSIGLQTDGLSSTANLLTLNYNSFVLNGIGIKAVNGNQPGFKAEHQWWGSASGPLAGDASFCANGLPPNPRSTPPDVICGLANATVDAAPWSTVPAGRIILPADKEGAITAAIGSTAQGDFLNATSVVTLTIPANSFAQAADLLLAPRNFLDSIPGQPTALGFEISAVVNGREVRQLAADHLAMLQIDYTSADLAGANEQQLKLYGYDETQGLWSYFGLTTVPNAAAKRVFAQIDHVGRLRLTALNFAKVWLPLAARE